MKRQVRSFLVLAALVAGITGSFFVQPAHAIDLFGGACSGGSSGTNSNGAATTTGGNTSTTGGSGGGTLCGATATDDAGTITKRVINTMLFVLGMIAVIMIVIGGIRYTTSNGDASATKAAKDTVLYAVIGLVVAIMAFAIVNFVITNVAK